jgi:hypothetical protein
MKNHLGDWIPGALLQVRETLNSGTGIVAKTSWYWGGGVVTYLDPGELVTYLGPKKIDDSQHTTVVCRVLTNDGAEGWMDECGLIGVENDR